MLNGFQNHQLWNNKISNKMSLRDMHITEKTVAWFKNRPMCKELVWIEENGII